MAGPYVKVFPSNFERAWRELVRFFKPAYFTAGNEEYGGALLSAQGVLYRAAGPIGSSTGGAVLVGTTVPAWTLVTVGNALRLRIQGVTAANGNTKTIVFKFGTASITLYNSTGSGIDFFYDITIVKTALNAQQISIAGYNGSTLISGLSTTATQNEETALVCELSLSTATGNNDVVVNDFLIQGDSG